MTSWIVGVEIEKNNVLLDVNFIKIIRITREIRSADGCMDCLWKTLQRCLIHNQETVLSARLILPLKEQLVLIMTMLPDALEDSFAKNAIVVLVCLEIR